jgi:hypothetical protein
MAPPRYRRYPPPLRDPSKLPRSWVVGCLLYGIFCVAAAAAFAFVIVHFLVRYW